MSIFHFSIELFSIKSLCGASLIFHFNPFLPSYDLTFMFPFIILLQKKISLVALN